VRIAGNLVVDARNLLKLWCGTIKPLTAASWACTTLASHANGITLADFALLKPISQNVTHHESMTPTLFRYSEEGRIASAPRGQQE
jgi:hypothetical protein